MMRGETKYLIVSKQTDQADPLAGAPISKTFATIDELKRELENYENLDKICIFEAHSLPVRVEKKVILG
jgi:hypothetical protein